MGPACTLAGRRRRYRVDDVPSADDLAEHHVLAVQPASLGEDDVELGRVLVGANVSHSHPAGRAVGQYEVLIVEVLGPIDRPAPSAIALGDVTHLDDEVLCHTVDDGVVVGQLLAASPVALGQGHKIECRHWYNIPEHRDDDPPRVVIPHALIAKDVDVKIDFVGHRIPNLLLVRVFLGQAADRQSQDAYR